MSNKNTIPDDKARLIAAEANIHVLEKRIASLEREMTLCLRFMRHAAEDMAKKKDPTFRPLEDVKA